MVSSTLLLSLVPALALASPVTKRAGGPAIVPIPSNCSVSYPLPGGAEESAGYMVNSEFQADNGLYSAYFDSTMSPSDQAQQCFEQCYGYGDPGQCHSALLAYNVPTPAGYYGTAGGVLETACLLYSEYLTEQDFTPAPAGQYTDEFAENIYCQRPAGSTD